MTGISHLPIKEIENISAIIWPHSMTQCQRYWAELGPFKVKGQVEVHVVNDGRQIEFCWAKTWFNRPKIEANSDLSIKR
jgi:hypothetical protein